MTYNTDVRFDVAEEPRTASYSRRETVGQSAVVVGPAPIHGKEEFRQYLQDQAQERVAVGQPQ